MINRIDPHEYDDLKTYGTIFQVLTIIAGVVLAVVGVSYLMGAADDPGVLARATRVTGGTYLAYALATVISGQFLKAVTNWMASVYANLADLRTKVAHLQSQAAHLAAPPTARPWVPTPFNAAANPNRDLARESADDLKPAKAIRSDNTLTCSNCGHSINASRGTTWHSCPSCLSPFIE